MPQACGFTTRNAVALAAAARPGDASRSSQDPESDPIAVVRSAVCPHDCPSTCALNVEVLDRSTIGAVRGAASFACAMRWSGRKGTICSTIATADWMAGCGRVSGADAREMAMADLNVLWGTNPASTQVNVMAHVTRAQTARLMISAGKR